VVRNFGRGRGVVEASFEGDKDERVVVEMRGGWSSVLWLSAKGGGLISTSETRRVDVIRRPKYRYVPLD
jgi:hypothetical protein